MAATTAHPGAGTAATTTCGGCGLVRPLLFLLRWRRGVVLGPWPNFWFAHALATGFCHVCCRNSHGCDGGGKTPVLLRSSSRCWAACRSQASQRGGASVHAPPYRVCYRGLGRARCRTRTIAASSWDSWRLRVLGSWCRVPASVPSSLPGRSMGERWPSAASGFGRWEAGCSIRGGAERRWASYSCQWVEGSGQFRCSGRVYRTGA